RPTGMFTSPKLTDPFHVVRIRRSILPWDGLDSPSLTGFLQARLRRVDRARTIANLWRDAVAAGHSDPAYLQEVDGEWREVTWAESARTVAELANGLLALGVRKGDSFALLARTSLEWAHFDFALALVGAVGAPIYANSSARDVQYLLERGRAHAVEHPGALDERADSIDEDDLFTFIYTSGTTGPPKACMIRHRNYYAMAACTDRVPEFAISDDVMLIYLPLAHNFGRLMHLLGAYAGYTIAFCPDPLRLAEVMPVVRPTILPSVPRVYEKVHTALQAQFDETRGVKRRLLDFSLRTGRRVSKLREQGRPVPPGLALRHRLADRLVFRKVKARLGGR